VILEFRLFSFGKPGSDFVQQEVQKYAKRMAGFSHVVLKAAKSQDSAQNVKQEAHQILERKNPGKLVLFSEEGKLYNTLELHKLLFLRITGRIDFVIGSAYGLDAGLKQQADALISLSPLTLTHDHALVLVVEQLYRCAMVHKGHPYHHE
jgi:23S rRNA (pseudouridine1915-N3)-methyltransferase